MASRANKLETILFDLEQRVTKSASQFERLEQSRVRLERELAAYGGLVRTLIWPPPRQGHPPATPQPTPGRLAQRDVLQLFAPPGRGRSLGVSVRSVVPVRAAILAALLLAALVVPHSSGSTSGVPHTLVASPIVLPPMPVVSIAASMGEDRLQLDSTAGTEVVRRGPLTGTLDVQSDPAGAAVFVNQRYVGETPLRLPWRAGSQTVWLERAGYERWTRAVSVPAERITRINAQLVPGPARPRPAERASR